MKSEVTTLYDLVKRRAAKTPDAIAIAAHGRPPLSYRSLLSRVESTVKRLRAFSLGRNDRVAMVLPNGPEMAVCFVAVSAGATCAPLNPASRANEFDFSMSDLSAKALLVWSDLESPARTVAAKLKIPIIDVKPILDADAGTFELVGESKGSVDATDGFALATDTALVLHTSGTTSRPKIVPLTQANICTSGRNISLTLGLTADDRCLNVMPLFHIHGLIGAVVASLTAGSRVICAPGFDAERFFEWVDTCRPTWYTAVPTIHQAILSRAPAHKDIIARCPLRFIRSSSAALSQGVMEKLETIFSTQVIEAYGMTEASHQMTSNLLAPLPRKPGSVGVAAGPVVAIMDESGQLLPAGETGEVVIRGPNVTAGYENNPAANDSAFINAWFRTGDQGRFDTDGYLFLTGRLKEIINRGGEKIVPSEVDEVLSQHPAIAQAIAFAVPHPTLGEDVAAAVVLKEGAAVTDSDVREFAAARLAGFKIPQQLVYVTEIPKGPTGKPQRIGLAEKLAEELSGNRQRDCIDQTSWMEAQLAQLWQELLKLDHVGTRDNFYLLGGDSLAMAVMLLEVERRFNGAVAMEHFLRCPTIETIARTLRTTGPPEPAESEANESKLTRDSALRGVKNRLLQCMALYAPGYKTTRVWLHRMRGVAIGRNVSIGLSALIETAYPQLVFIGDNVTIGMRAMIIAHLRDRTDGSRASHEYTVRIEDEVYIGPGVIILPNVTIGRGAVVSAGSVVSRSVPPRTLVRGNPAEPIAHCGVSLGGGVAYEEFVRHLKPLGGDLRGSGTAGTEKAV